jgi:dephospho-CoA kinase
MMIKVALTGNFGSGKSTVAHLFSVLGIPVFHADAEAKLLYKDADVKQIILDLFGKDVFDADDDVDFKQLAKLIFNDPQSLQQINQIIHPLVFKRYNDWLAQNKEQKYTIHEAAIVFENHLEHHYDLIINVTASEKIRMNRVMQRDGITERQFQARAKNQWTDDKKNKKADFIIFNDGDQFIIPQVMQIHKEIIHI